MTFSENPVSPATTTSHYPYVDWLADWVFVDQLQAECAAMGHELDSTKFLEHFGRKYGALSEGRCSRIAAALCYIENHADELNAGIIAMVGKSIKSGNKVLLITCHVIYSQCPPEDIESDFAIESVLALARQIAERFVRSGISHDSL